MMTLVDSSDLVIPILRSELFRTSKKLREKGNEITKAFAGFKLTNKWKLNQFEILDEKKEKVIKEFIALYEELSQTGHR